MLAIITSIYAADNDAQRRAREAQRRDAERRAKDRQVRLSQEKAKPAPAPLTVPAGAVETAPGTYSYTDPAGKKWVYRKTPFGVSRMEDKGESADAAGQGTKPADAEAWKQVTATEDGDTVRFTRPGPFGAYKWETKKSDLSEQEKAVLDRQRSERKSGDAARQDSRQD